MRLFRWTTLLLAFVIVLVLWVEPAAAYYHAQLGRFVNRDPIGYSASDANLYRYCGDDPTNRTDPSGQLCQVAVHCGPARTSKGLVNVSSHCGLTIKTDQGITTIDGRGGNVGELYTHPGAWGGETVVGQFTDLPDAACQCLLGYIPTFNAPRLPRGHLEGNSNWALNCLVSHCSQYFTIPWGKNGAMEKPIGYDTPPCKKLECIVVPGSAAAAYNCVERYACP